MVVSPPISDRVLHAECRLLVLSPFCISMVVTGFDPEGAVAASRLE